MNGVDENTPPPIPSFDKNKYRLPNSKQPLQYSTNDMNEGGEDGMKFELFVNCDVILTYIFFIFYLYKLLLLIMQSD